MSFLKTAKPFWPARFMFYIMFSKTEIKQLRSTVSLENIAGNISCKGNTFRLDTNTLELVRYTLYLLTEDSRKAWNFKYQNLVFSFLTYVIILLFPPIYMVIEHSFMNYSYTAKSSIELIKYSNTTITFKQISYSKQ